MYTRVVSRRAGLTPGHRPSPSVDCFLRPVVVARLGLLLEAIVVEFVAVIVDSIRSESSLSGRSRLARALHRREYHSFRARISVKLCDLVG